MRTTRITAGTSGIRVQRCALIAEMKKADLMVSLGERITDSVSQSYTFRQGAAAATAAGACVARPRTRSTGCGGLDLGIPCVSTRSIKALVKRGAPADAKRRAGCGFPPNAIHRSLLAKEWDATSDGINFAAIVCEVDKHLADDATVTSDAGNFGSFVHRYIGFRQSQVFLSAVVGAMGSGMPMAVAASLRRPGKQVVAFVGDGGALMAGNEIATAVQYGGAPISITLDIRCTGRSGCTPMCAIPSVRSWKGRG